MLLGFALVVPVYLQATLGLLPLPRQLDVPLMRMGGWPDFAATVDRQRRAGRGTFLAAEDYGLASQLALWAPENVPVIGVASRWRHFNLGTRNCVGLVDPHRLVAVRAAYQRQGLGLMQKC